MDGIIKAVIKKNNLDEDLPIKEFTDGQINHVYQLGEDYILKVQKELDVLLHQPSIVQLGVEKGAKIPKIFDSGKIQKKEYLLTEKMVGRKLSSDWLSFSETKKENLIIQIVEQLKILHSIHFEKYSPQRPHEFDNWKDAVDFLTSNINGFDGIDLEKLNKKTRENFELIKQYYQDNLDILNETGTAAFVHNDLHFENILYQDDEITGLIDFDFARQAPKDFELWHLIDFFYSPFYYVEEKLEPMWKKYELGNEIKLFKKHYPELFEHKNLLIRLRLYMVDQLIDDIKYPAIDKFNKKVDQYFKSDWVDEQILNN